MKTMQQHTQDVDISRSANNPLRFGDKAHSAVSIRMTSLLAVVRNRSVSVRRAAIIAFAVLLLASMGLAQQASPADLADTGNVDTGASNSRPEGDGLEPSGGAHCFCETGPSLGNIVKKFGAIWHYGINNKKNRSDCSNRCWDYMETWGLRNQGNRPEVCTDFYKDGGAPLNAYWAVGTDNYTGPSYTLHPSDIGYPLSCGLSSGIKPRYYVLDLIYAPPGCTPDTSSATGYSCKPGSSVSYGTSSSTGAMTTMQSSIQDDVTLTATLGSAKEGDITPFSGSLSYGWTGSNTSGSSETITKTSSSTLTLPAGGGPVSGDGITHEQDQLVTLLNPGAIYANWEDPSTSHQYVAWTMGFTGGSPVTQNLSVSWLRCALIATGNYNQVRIYKGSQEVPCDPMPQNVQYTLQNVYHLTFDDFFNILQLDPYWHSASNPITVDTSRFTAEPFDFPYQPPVKNPFPIDWNCLGKVVNVTNSFTDESTFGSSQQYSVGYDVAFGFPKFFKLEAKEKLTWTNTVSHKNTQTDSQSATASVYCSSVDWGSVAINPSRVNTYYDALYGGFLFDLSDLPAQKKLVSSGQVVDSAGQPARSVQLALLYAGQTYHTFTDNDGNFSLYGAETAQEPLTATLSVIGPNQTVTETVTVGATTTIVLPESFGQQPR